jgi:hypothetical protein
MGFGDYSKLTVAVLQPTIMSFNLVRSECDPKVFTKDIRFAHSMRLYLYRTHSSVLCVVSLCLHWIQRGRGQLLNICICIGVVTLRASKAILIISVSKFMSEFMSVPTTILITSKFFGTHDGVALCDT